MPTYEYACRKCGKKFSQSLTISQHDKQRVRCPKCGARQVEQQVAGFFPVTSKKS